VPSFWYKPFVSFGINRLIKVYWIYFLFTNHVFKLVIHLSRWITYLNDPYFEKRNGLYSHLSRRQLSQLIILILNFYFFIYKSCILIGYSLIKMNHIELQKYLTCSKIWWKRCYSLIKMNHVELQKYLTFSKIWWITYVSPQVFWKKEKWSLT